GQCATGLLCIQSVCSDGGPGSGCDTVGDCNTKFCIGEKCSNGGVGETCVEPANCDTGLVCGRGTCNVGNVGDPCELATDCINHTCAAALGAALRYCEPAPGGRPCKQNDQCLYQQCT